MDDWEIRKESVLQQLHLLDAVELATVCASHQITIPPGKVGKKSLIYNLLSRYINSEDVEDSDDQGLALFTDMDEQLKAILSKRVKGETAAVQEIITETTTTTGTGDSSKANMASTPQRHAEQHSAPPQQQQRIVPSTSSATSSADVEAILTNNQSGGRLRFTKLKEFKIHGGFVATGQEIVQLVIRT